MKKIYRNIKSIVIKYFKKGEPEKKMNWNTHLNDFLLTVKNIGYTPDIIIDIGANRGNWSRSALEIFPKSKIIMFEPQVELNKYLNDLTSNPNVTLINKGLGKGNGKFTMSKLGRHDSATFRKLEKGLKEVDQIQVDVICLDDFINDSSITPNLIKIDAEGLDLDVLNGGLKVLEKADIVLVEASVAAGFKNSVYNVIEFMDKHSYLLFDITDLNRLPRTNCLVLVELAFVRRNGNFHSRLNVLNDYIDIVNNG